MKNPIGNKLKKLVFGMFDQMVEGSDKYVTEKGSTWLIFTDEKRWVFEFTKDQTLWFSYYLFQSELELIGKDSMESKDLIKDWFEDRFLNIRTVEDTIQNGVRYTYEGRIFDRFNVEDTIQNGVRYTEVGQNTQHYSVDDTIQNGVKHTRVGISEKLPTVEDTIQNGVREIRGYKQDTGFIVDDTIQNGVRHTRGVHHTALIKVEDTIENGVKHTEDGDWLDGDERFNEIIQNGVKEIHDDCSNNIGRVEGVIINGSKNGI